MTERIATLSQDHPIKLWRGRQAVIVAMVGPDMYLAHFPNEEQNTFFVSKSFLSDEREATTTKLTRMQALRELEAYETALRDAWEGTGDDVEMTAATERIVKLLMG